MAARKKKKVVKPNQEYELPATCTFKGLRILALDPGSKNMGISVVGVKNWKPVVLANSVMTKPINTLVDFKLSRESFLAEIDRWVKVFRPQAIIAERFQTRGNGGPLIEFVSVMLGLLGGRYYPLPTKLITASTWKNSFNRRFQPELERMYPDAEKLDLKLIYPDLKMTPHAFDSSLIGIYGLEFGLRHKLIYTPRGIMRAAEQASLIPWIEKRKRAPK